VADALYGRGADDFQQAEWLADRFRGEWRFDHSMDVWHHWDGVRWAADKTNDIYHAVSREASLHLIGYNDAVSMFGAADANRLFGGRTDIARVDDERLRKALEKLRNIAPIERAIKALGSLAEYRTDGSDWDTEPHLLGCANGIVDLRSNTLIAEPTPDMLVTKSTGVKFKPITGPDDFYRVAPRFIDVLSEWTADYDKSEDASMMSFLLLWFGASLFGFQPEQRFLLMTGSGRNGKGALKHAILQAIGPEYGIQPDGNLYSRSKFGPARSNEARADLMSLKGKRIAFFSEPDRGQFNEEMLKAHTGGDTITARGLYQRVPVSWEPTHSITFLVNDAPSLDDVGPSMGSRVMVADFRHRFDGLLEDKNLYNALAKEKAGILAILCWAAKRWYEQWDAGDGGLTMPPRVVEQSKAFMERNDPLSECLREAFAVHPDVKSPSQAAYDAYRDWHTRSGTEGDYLSQVRFASDLQKKGFVKVKTPSGMVWKGLRPLGAMDLALKGAPDDPET
jgi:putative DNA primase/helicase